MGNPIFISYKRADKEKVFNIKEYIESQTGMNCWIDLNGIESDAQFDNVIIKAISACEVMLFMYSQTHLRIVNPEKDWTIKELNFASFKQKRVVFVNIDGSPLTDWFGFHYGTKQQVDGRDQTRLSRLATDIKQWLHMPKSNEEMKEQLRKYRVIHYANGDIYEGELLNGKPDGKGKLTFAEGGWYEGEWTEDEFNGYGVWHDENGNIYEGEWLKDNRHGKGKFTFAAGGWYEGEWAEDKFNGYGVWHFSNGDIYEGEWLKGNRHGKGKLTYAAGGWYEGEWAEDKFNGYGIMHDEDGIYEGEWLNGTYHGKGKFTCESDWYEGDWVEGEMSGYGVMHYDDGGEYAGEWLNGKYHGHGTLTFPNGDLLQGNWVDDEFVEK